MANPLRKAIADAKAIGIGVVYISPDQYLALPEYQRPLPEDQRGHCLVCGAGFIEHIACQSGDCHFVRAIEDGPA